MERYACGQFHALCGGVRTEIECQSDCDNNPHTDPPLYTYNYADGSPAQPYGSPHTYTSAPHAYTYAFPHPKTHFSARLR